jgi:DNA-binding MarR family transcriptional regulator
MCQLLIWCSNIAVTLDPGAEAWAMLVGISMSLRARWLEAGQEEGLTPPQAMSLMSLRAEEPRRLGELARTMHCDASYATALADRLEERGFVERRPSATDRRVKELVPTAAGLAAQARLKAAYTAPPPGMEDVPLEDQEALLRVARTLAARIDPEHAARFNLAPQGGARG